EIESVCRELNIEVLGGHTEVTDVVNQPVVTVTGVGKVAEGNVVSTAGLKPGDELVMTKWAGMEGTAILAAEKREKLLETLPRELLDTAAGFIQFISVVPEAMVAKEAGVHAMHDVTEGGIFGALWEMGAASGVGIEADLKKIPVRQETIEICEVFGLNPYQMMSSGSMLIGCENGNHMVDALKKQGIPASVIGKATDTNDRIVVNGEETRYLAPAGSDELHKV
ncbi:MAG: hydrogenase maturation factor, partial [Lachnospiraceae bacterium]|nr:hydrogenase maturation factor [Lachnospiraceae bacterium]